MRTVCARCGIYRTVTERGAQRNRGELETSTIYEDADEWSEEWAKEQRGEDDA